VTDIVAVRGSEESASASIEQFGYRQELKRSLSLFDLVVYGLIYIVPIAPFGIFGFVFNSSNGMVPLVYAVGVVAMAFTALSYVAMSRAFPIAGSVYSYAGRGIGESAGFLAGWTMLLDYVLLPVLGCIVCAVAMQAVLPSVPRAVWIILILGFNTTINFLGIEATARLNTIFLVLQLALLGLFMVLAVVALANGVGGARLSLSPLYQASTITPSLIFGALSLAALSFLGFDAISTLAEEARGGPSAVGRATLLSLCLAGLLFIAQTYFASLFVLGQTGFARGEETDAAFYTIAAIIGGAWLKFAVSVFGVFLSVVAGVLANQAATARLVFGMARDGKLPRIFAHVDTKRKVPERAIFLVAAINLVLGLSMANQIEMLTSMVNFGALTGFLMLHLSVMVHFMWRQKSQDWIRHLLVPLAGFAIIAYVLVNMGTQAKVAGLAWLTIGIVALIGLKLGGRRATLPT
jgi:amino acid transporter